MDDCDSIDPRTLIKQLEPDQLGMYEPLGGLMFLNVSTPSFQAMTQRWSAGACTESDIAFIRATNHEVYHFAQSAASGYMFDRSQRLFEVLNQASLPELRDLDQWAQIEAKLREDAGDNSALRARGELLVAIGKTHEAFAILEERAAKGDNSVAGALVPEFFRAQATLAQEEAKTDARGLSISGLIEGSAVIHTNLLMCPADPLPQLEADLASQPAVYSELLAVTRAAVGDRSIELVLPAVALALCYQRPNFAFHPLLAMVAGSSPGEAIERGRAISAALPAIADAGTVLGTSIDARAKGSRCGFYDKVIDRLATGEWGVDAYGFLADPAVMHKVESFPMGFITQDGYYGSLDRVELVGRMVIASLVLRVRSRRREEKQFRAIQLAWARSLIDRLGGVDSG